MSWLRLRQICEMAGGELHGGDAAVESVGTDSRTIEPGALFVALKGGRFDGHDYIDAARCAGAAAVMAHRAAAGPLPVVEVGDTMAALARLAREWRRKLPLEVIALTGSNGKTTTKEMLAAIMRSFCKSIATRGNFNNHIGVPLTLLRLRDAHRCAVVEMGANHPGEIRALCGMARPGVGMVLNAAAAHIEGFGNLDSVAAAKGEMYEALGEDGTGVFNRDDAYFDYWLRRFNGRRSISFGFSAAADVSARLTGGGAMELRVFDRRRRCRLRLAGRHNVVNALAAAAAAHAAGADMDAIITGLEAVKPLPGRLVNVHGGGGLAIIDDSYNANPASLRAALAVLGEHPGRRWLALGDMAELGDESNAAHVGAAVDARGAGVERLMTVGAHARLASAEFGGGGVHFDSLDAMAHYIRAEAPSGVCLLVKGSRCAQMERLVNALAAPAREA